MIIEIILPIIIFGVLFYCIKCYRNNNYYDRNKYNYKYE